MVTTKRLKVKSTPFSDFIRHASESEQKAFFSKVVKATIKEQRAMIAKAQEIQENLYV